MRHTSLLVLALFILPACGEEPVALWGSIDEIFSLEFDEHRVIKQGTALRIEYVKTLSGGSEEKPAKLVVETQSIKIVPNSDLNNEYFEDGTVQLDRVAAVGGEYPPVTSGKLHFDEYEFLRGTTISGNFTILFENGRNLFGNFEAEVDEEEVE